jgi:hypothetical protein
MSIEKTRRERMGVMGGGRRVGNGTSWLRCLQVKGQMLVVLGGADAPCYGLVVTVLHEDFSWDSLRRVRGEGGWQLKQPSESWPHVCYASAYHPQSLPTYLYLDLDRDLDLDRPLSPTFTSLVRLHPRCSAAAGCWCAVWRAARQRDCHSETPPTPSHYGYDGPRLLTVCTPPY